MKKAVLKGAALGALILTGSLAAGQAALAAEYEVTIQSLTHSAAGAVPPGQPIAPSLFVTHDETFSLLEVGPASNMDPDQYFGLAVAAETGAPFVLAAALGADLDPDMGILSDDVDANGIGQVVVLPHPNLPPNFPPGFPPILLPGNENSLEEQGLDPIKGKPGDYFSAVAMLGATNDAFYGVRNVVLPKNGSITIYADAYDAGSEANSEALDDVPPGGNMDENGLNNIAVNGEGHIHVHAGIHGVPGRRGGWDDDYLNPTVYDWRNPVVAITITRVDDGE